MRPLAAVERFFERLFERPAARLFRVRLHPVQLQRRIERSMESQRLVESNRTLVPDHYTVRLNAADLAGFGEMSDRLATDLADEALRFARAHRFLLSERPRVVIIADDAVAPGDIRVDARFGDRRDARGRVPRAMRGAPTDESTHAQPAPEDGDAQGQAADREPRRGAPDHTMVFEVPHATPPLARLKITRGVDPEREISVGGGRLTIGRAPDNTLVLPDPRVSRHHARMQLRRGTLVLTDLGSTNGTRVNGVRVGEVVLGEADQIEIGETLLVVESVPTT